MHLVGKGASRKKKGLSCIVSGGGKGNKRRLWGYGANPPDKQSGFHNKNLERRGVEKNPVAE